ncbi:hypothetical protein PIB30_028798 [Stylosanthes scabra]|uniref:Uncharacterized protein n=1 Tax=Stylosanthes scabra TaxID=79078 RepID=A0ABU6RBE2_9FABA|nr:hypothetical protein [Stylosanthes scabra]
MRPLGAATFVVGFESPYPSQVWSEHLEKGVTGCNQLNWFESSSQSGEVNPLRILGIPTVLIPRWIRVNPRYLSKLTSGAGPLLISNGGGVCNPTTETERTRGTCCRQAHCSIPVITVVNPCCRDLTLASRGVQIAVPDLTPFLPIQSYGELTAKVFVLPIRCAAQGQDAYAWLHVKRTHRLQEWPSRFCCDPFIPFALSGHFRSELCLLDPETLKHTHQGIVRNGKRFKT